MGLNREDKATVIAEISEVVSNSSAMVIAEYRGLTVQAVTKLRAEARKNGVTVRVVKNTLVRRAVEGTGFAGLADQFTGPLVYGFSADPVAVAKVLVNFAKDNESSLLGAVRWLTTSWTLKLSSSLPRCRAAKNSLPS